jgi:ubiquinone/menaquinone biosynthesis C-methylase UbiE
MATLVKRAVRKVGKVLFPKDRPKRRKKVPLNNPYPIRMPVSAGKSVVDEYWGDYTIRSDPYATAQDVLDFLKWRSDHFHKSYEFKGFWDDHQGKVVLDYGCGPGHDLVGFSVFSKPKKLYGMDISHKALSLAGHNLGLHKVPADKIELIQTADIASRIPLPDASVDYLHCCGVLMCTSDPVAIMKEFHRVLKPNGRCLVMVYNRASTFFHLYVAFARRFLEPELSGKSVDEVFTQSTDGPACPVSRAYDPAEYQGMCEKAGFKAEFVGGFVASNELTLWDMHAGAGLRDPRLEEPHKSFIREVEFDKDGLPMYRGKYAGIGGTFRLKKL